MSQHVYPVIFIAAVLSVTGCAGQSAVQSSVSADLPANDLSVLAGEWEYEDGAAITLRLDEQGNGTYAYKDGRFETTQFAGHTWAGKWYQKENDREGGFSVTLSKDHSEGQGTWWYARIGADHTPTQKGGTFHLSKKSSLATLSATPPVP
ncbi:MAG: hypothetical protein HP491_06295 [Nitrospira sp.]|nr:hypothetical protein [Nitrospira sp.]MBH0182382.1 hypothetical protein [Nitrospira sp.]MBH0186551.1 hypothetical protein [Nitrospira sp.]